jgi:hypothetical protein
LTIIRSVRARKFVINPELVLYVCTIIAALSALRGIVFEAVFFVCYYNTLPTPEPLQLPNFLQKVKKVIKPVYGIAAFYTATIVLSGCFGYDLLTEHISIHGNTEPLTVLHDVLDSEDTEGKTVFCDYLTEGETMRLEYGMLPYIDDRLETFNPNINGGNPILDEFTLARNKEQDFENLLNKYEFDYIVLRVNDESSQIETSDWMSSNSDYELLANTSDYDLASYEIPTSGVDNYKIYVRKTLAN